MNRNHGWIIYPRYVSHHDDNAFDWLTEEAAACGLSAEVVFAEDITAGYFAGKNYLTIGGRIPDALPSFVVIRTYDTVLSRFFERLDIPVINSSYSMELSKNKMLTHEVLHSAGIPTPRTVYSCNGEYDYEELCDAFSDRRFIVKRIDGAKGEDVYLVNDAAEMRKAVEACSRRCICQQFIASSSGRDVRVWVIGGKVAGAVLRYSETSFLSNFSQGGKVAAIHLAPDAASLAVESTEALGIEFAGIDLLFDENGFTVNEINGNAGFRTLSRIGENNIPETLFGYIRDKYSK